MDKEKDMIRKLDEAELEAVSGGVSVKIVEDSLQKLSTGWKPGNDDVIEGFAGDPMDAENRVSPIYKPK